MWKFYIFLAILLSFINAQNYQGFGDETEFDPDREFSSYPLDDAYDINYSELEKDPETSTADHRIFKYAWDMPNYGDDEELAYARRHKVFEINWAGLAYFGYEYGHSPKDNYDFQAVFFYSSFRPFVLDFKDVDIAFGAFFITNFRKNIVDDVNIDASGDDFTLQAGADAIEADSETFIVGLDVLFNFPRQAFQIQLQVGQMWLYLTKEMDIDFNVDIADVILIDGGLEGLDYNQRDRAFFFNLTLRKVYDRPFLNSFTLFLRATIQMDTYSRSTRARPDLILEIGGVPIDIGDERSKLPAFIDPAGGKEVDLNTYEAMVNIHLFDIPVYLPIPGAEAGIGIGFLGGFGHRTGEEFGQDLHGLRSTAGALVSMGMFNVIYQYTFDDQSDINDVWSVTVVIGLFGSKGSDLPIGGGFGGSSPDVTANTVPGR